MFGGRVSSQHTCGCCSCSSAASSIVTIRSLRGMKPDRMLSTSSCHCRGAARHQHVHLRATARRATRHRRRQAVVAHEVVHLQRIDRETPDRHQRPVDRGRRDDRVHASRRAAARRPSSRFVDAAPDARHDLLDHLHQVRVVVTSSVGSRLAEALDIRPAGTCSRGCRKRSGRAASGPNRTSRRTSPVAAARCRSPAAARRGCA